MKRLRHPIRAIREPFGTAGLIVACLALVLAMGGAAVAAKGGLSGKQKKEVAKIAKKEAKKYAGKNGKNGTNGTNGTNGAKGDKGDTGATGPQGPAGPQGPQGPTGATGSPWTAGGVLPSKQTETGTWTLRGQGAYSINLSFNIPLSAAPNNVQILAPGEGETAECPGTVAAPEAAPGELCVYTQSLEHATKPNSVQGLYTSGAVLSAFELESGAIGWGTWAVTAH